MKLNMNFTNKRWSKLKVEVKRSKIIKVHHFFQIHKLYFVAFCIKTKKKFNIFNLLLGNSNTEKVSIAFFTNKPETFIKRYHLIRAIKSNLVAAQGFAKFYQALYNPRKSYKNISTFAFSIS